MVARRAHNPEVARSSRVPATTGTTSILEWFFYLGLLGFQLRHFFGIQFFRDVFLYLYSIFTTYVLYSPSHNKIYIGYTSNLIGRIESHNIYATKGWTINFRPWELLYKEVFETKSEAMKREKQLKTAKGREYIWSIVSEKYG